MSLQWWCEVMESTLRGIWLINEAMSQLCCTVTCCGCNGMKCEEGYPWHLPYPPTAWRWILLNHKDPISSLNDHTIFWKKLTRTSSHSYKAFASCLVHSPLLPASEQIMCQRKWCENHCQVVFKAMFKSLWESIMLLWDVMWVFQFAQMQQKEIK